MSSDISSIQPITQSTLVTRPFETSSAREVTQLSALRAEKERIVSIIQQNQGIVDVRTLQREAFQSEGFQTFPASLQDQYRRVRLRPLAYFLASLIDPSSPNPSMRSFARGLADLYPLRPEALPRYPDAIIELLFLDDPDGNRLSTLFEIIMQDQEAGLLNKLMHGLDKYTLTVSRTNVEAMDQAKREGRARVRKNVVLIGGGPITSTVASVLGLLFRVTVVTEQRGLGKPWRDFPIFLNSSCAVEDSNGAPLPLLEGPTTRLIGRGLPGNLDSNVLLGADTKEVLCDDGSVVQYPSGLRLGDLVAINSLFNADDFLVDQRADVSQIQRNPDGTLRLVLIDTQDGTRRELDADAVFLLTGPGKEQTKVEDAATQALYRKSSEQLEGEIREARARIAAYRETLRRLEAQLPTPNVVQEQTRVRDLIAQTTIRVPHVLSLSSIRAIYEFWQDDLGGDPAAYLRILGNLFTGGSTGYGGNADTMRTLKELRERRGPKNAYPAGLTVKEGRSLIYNEGTSSPEEYDQANRRRYRGTFTAKTTAIPFKVSRYRLIRDRRSGRERVEVWHRDANGKMRRRVVDYFFDCTGLNRTPIEAQLPASLPLQDIRDQQGAVVARGNTEANLFIAGSATGFRANEFPDEIQTIIAALGIPENTLALWVHGALAERTAWWFAATHAHTRKGGYARSGN